MNAIRDGNHIRIYDAFLAKESIKEIDGRFYDPDDKAWIRSVAAGIAVAIHSAGCSYAVSADPSFAGRYEQWAVESGRHHGVAAIG